MKYSEFKRWLADQGCTFKEGGNHTKVYLNGKQTVLGRHPGKEIKKGTLEAIKKALGLN